MITKLTHPTLKYGPQFKVNFSTYSTKAPRTFPLKFLVALNHVKTSEHAIWKSSLVGLAVLDKNHDKKIKLSAIYEKQKIS